MLKAISIIFGTILLFCGLAPLIYLIFNFGTGFLCVLGLFFIVLPRLYILMEGFPGLRVAMLAGIALFLIYSAVVSAIMAWKAWHNPPPDSGEVTVIVLGARINGSEPSLMLRRRLDKAAQYMRQNPEAICVVTGGQGPGEDLPEAQVMGDYLKRFGIASDRIIREGASSNTRENFQFSAVLLEEQGLEKQPVVVVTDSFHQLRAYIFAKSALPYADGFYAISSLTPWGLLPAYWVRELLAIPVALIG